MLAGGPGVKRGPHLLHVLGPGRPIRMPRPDGGIGGLEWAMFTGLVQHVGRVETLERTTGGGARVIIGTGDWPHGARAGDSIAVNGCCLTVAEAPAGARLAFDAVAETLAKTTLGGLAIGSKVNLERSLAAGDLLGGHMVQGHIEGTGEVVRVRAEEGDWRVWVRAPGDLMPAIVPKGSITVDGVSLTVADVDVEAGTFGVALIPTTLELTTLADLRAGSRCNLETDIIARTVVHVMRNFR
jgi:riboflavin synthase